MEELKKLDAGHVSFRNSTLECSSLVIKRFTADNGTTFPFRGKGIQIPTPDEVFSALPDALFNILILQYICFLIYFNLEKI